MNDRKRICDIVDRIKSEAFEISEYIWNNPELAMQEYKAAGKLTEYLERNGFDVEKGTAGIPTAFTAVYGSGRPVIGFSSEYDALPGLSQKKDSVCHDPVIPMAPGHGCGHNLIATGGILSAVALKEFMEEKELEGTIKVFGTPAEELCIGKPFMAKAGAFEGVDAFVDWHPSFENKAAACDTNAYFNIKYHFSGRTSHGNAPWNGRSTLDAAILMGHAIEMLREHIKPGTEQSPTTLNYALPDVGNSFPNVVPDRTILWCIGRMKDADISADVIKRLQACAEGCAIATGTTVETEVITATHDMIPNICLCKDIEKNLRYVGVPEYSNEDQKAAGKVQENMGEESTGYDCRILETVPGSQPVTDSSEYSWHAPIAFLQVALSPSEKTFGHNWAVTKFAGSEVSRRVLETASKTLALTAYDILTDPALLEEAKQELREKLGGRKYESLIPEGTEPDLETNRDIMEKFKS